MLDKDLAKLYNTDTRSLNQAVKRNIGRFPKEFMFQLTEKEVKILISQNVISSWGGMRKFPFVFTEQGVAMLSSVLRSDIAIKVSIEIIKAFVSIKRFIFKNKKMAEKNKFQKEFMFQLTKKESNILKSQFVTSNNNGTLRFQNETLKKEENIHK